MSSMIKRGSIRYGTEQWIMLNIFHRDNFPLKHSMTILSQQKALYEE